MCDVRVLHPDHPKVYARWTVIIGGGKSPNGLRNHRQPASQLPNFKAKVQGRLEPVLARGEKLSLKHSVLSAQPQVVPTDGVH